MRESRWNRRTLLAGGALTACLLAAAAWAGAVGGSLLESFTAGRFAEARSELRQTGPGEFAKGEGLLAFLLTEEPDQAEALMGNLAAGQESSRDAWDARSALEEADLAYARRDFSDALKAIEPVLGGNSESPPGALYLRAGLACRALGKLQRAREMLASVHPDDPAFGLARFYLGDIALEQGDPSLALRYFDGAAKALPSGEGGAVAQARWRALTALDRHDEAAALRKKYGGEDGGGLSWLAVSVPVRTPAASTDTTVVPEQAAGRFCLQWAAFRDRSLALDFVRNNRERISGLRIVPGTGSDGIPLYRVRSGSFNDPQEARRRAAELTDTLHMEVLVTETE